MYCTKLLYYTGTVILLNHSIPIKFTMYKNQFVHNRNCSNIRLCIVLHRPSPLDKLLQPVLCSQDIEITPLHIYQLILLLREDLIFWRFEYERSAVNNPSWDLSWRLPWYCSIFLCCLKETPYGSLYVWITKGKQGCWYYLKLWTDSKYFVLGLEFTSNIWCQG